MRFCKTCKERSVFEIRDGISCGKSTGLTTEEKDPITDITKQGHFFTCRICKQFTLWVESEYSKRYIRKIKARTKRWDQWKLDHADYVKKMQDKGHKI